MRRLTPRKNMLAGRYAIQEYFFEAQSAKGLWGGAWCLGYKWRELTNTNAGGHVYHAGSPFHSFVGGKNSFQQRRWQMGILPRFIIYNFLGCISRLAVRVP
jgi:hypothetical protein